MNYWNVNSKLRALNSCVQKKSLSYWQDSSKLNSLNSCVQNISVVCWSDNVREKYLNTCLQNVSSNLLDLTSQSSISTVNCCVTNASFFNLNSSYISVSSVSCTTLRKVYVTSRGYLTAAPAVNVNMNTNSLNLTNGNGIVYFYNNTNKLNFNFN